MENLDILYTLSKRLKKVSRLLLILFSDIYLILSSNASFGTSVNFPLSKIYLDIKHIYD